jgi:plastocyanin
MKKVLIFVTLLLSFAALSSCGGNDTQTPMPNPTPEPTPTPDNSVITLTFSASSAQDYTLESVEGATTVGAAGALDPEITLEVGKRYRIINKALGAHPFALSGSETYNSSSVLLGDSSVSMMGSFETNADVKFVENTDGFTFTLTQALADQLKSYLCIFHSSMFGKVTVQ